MELARPSCFFFAVCAAILPAGCGRSPAQPPAVSVTMPEDGGAKGDGFAAWSDDYGKIARQQLARQSSSSDNAPHQAQQHPASNSHDPRLPVDADMPEPADAPLRNIPPNNLASQEMVPATDFNASRAASSSHESIRPPATEVHAANSRVSRNGRPAIRNAMYGPRNAQQRLIRFAMSTDGRWGAVIRSDGTIDVYDLNVEILVCVISTTQGNFLDAAFLPHSDQLVTLRPRYGDDDKPLSVWGLRERRLRGAWPIELDAARIVASPTSRMLVLADQQGAMTLMTLPDHSDATPTSSPLLAPLPPLASATAMTIDPLGNHVAVGFDDGRVTVCEIVGNVFGKPTQFESHPGTAIRGLSISADGRILATGGAESVLLWEQWQTDRPRQTIALADSQAPVYGVALGIGGRLAIAACGNAGTFLWDTQTGAQLDRFRSQPTPVEVAFSESAHRLAIVSANSFLSVWPIQGPGVR
ncbi:MAG: WD40 repeat domain-containing protein [Blastopirellula sp. JB062]